jgi:hypothetical protein
MRDRVKNPGSKKTISSFIRSHTMRKNGIEDKKVQGRKSPNNSKVRGSSPREIS